MKHGLPPLGDAPLADGDHWNSCNLVLDFICSDLEMPRRPSEEAEGWVCEAHQSVPDELQNAPVLLHIHTTQPQLYARSRKKSQARLGEVKQTHTGWADMLNVETACKGHSDKTTNDIMGTVGNADIVCRPLESRAQYSCIGWSLAGWPAGYSSLLMAFGFRPPGAAQNQDGRARQQLGLADEERHEGTTRVRPTFEGFKVLLSGAL